MSADNGVYVLVSRGRKTRHGYKTEYRVTHAQAIDNIYWQPDYPFGTPIQAYDRDFFVLNREYVLSYFGGARVFTDRRVAEGYAQAIYDMWVKDFGFVEYGIVWFDQYAHIPFPKPQQSGQRLNMSAVS